MDDIIRDWDLSSYIASDREISIETSHGMYFGLCPVATLDDVGAIRENNPISLMHFAKEEADERKWLLVATEMRGRNENREGIDKPHLLGVRVYKSVMGDQKGKPTDRIRYLQDLMNKDATNISHSIPLLRSIIFEIARTC